MFSEKLNEYIKALDCSARELSEHSGLSAATISRYRSGERTPKPFSEDMDKLCKGILSIAEEKGAEDFSDVGEVLNGCVSEYEFDYESFHKKLNLLFSALSVNVSELARTLSYDSSYISRVRTGKRKPSDPQKFSFEIAEFVSRRYDMKIIAEILNADCSDIADAARAITEWLCGSKTAAENPVLRFLEKLNDFDLNEYIRAIHFDELKVPTVPFRLPSSKTYYGLEEMKNGEIDFLKATALSKSAETVFMCSDMQMDDMASDLDFAKKYMFGIAAMLKKGLHLNVVHNLNRPFNEIMLGFESWIPLYMTGQISPYYLKGVHNKVYCHFLNVSGSAALSGESISGHHSDGKYYLTNSKKELAYYRKKSEFILKKALPLMDIYRSDSAGVLNAFLLADSKTDGKRRYILSSPPLYTASEEFIESFLKKRSVPYGESQNILRNAEMQRQIIGTILTANDVATELHVIPKEEFERYPTSLLAMFCDKKLVYSYEEYLMHIEQTRAFAERNKNYSLKLTDKSAFRNIQIAIHGGEWAMISKSNPPSAHFVVRHPVLRNAIENFVIPVTEE